MVEHHLFCPIGGGVYLLSSIIHIRYCVIPMEITNFSPLHTNFSPFPLSTSLPLYLYTPIYIYSIFHTILCKYSGHISKLSIYLSCVISLSCVIYLSYLSTYLLSNIYYIYNKYPIYLSLPYNLYTHYHICSIFIIDYVIIQLISNDLSHMTYPYPIYPLYIIPLSPCMDGYIYRWIYMYWYGDVY